MNKAGVSPDGEYAMATIAGVDSDVNETVAFAVRDGNRTRLCIGSCLGRWTSNGRLLLLSGEGVQLAAGQNVAFKLTRAHALPDTFSPREGLDFTKAVRMPPQRVPVNSDASEYVELRESLQRNLFRIPLH